MSKWQITFVFCHLDMFSLVVITSLYIQPSFYTKTLLFNKTYQLYQVSVDYIIFPSHKYPQRQSRQYHASICHIKLIYVSSVNLDHGTLAVNVICWFNREGNENPPLNNVTIAFDGRNIDKLAKYFDQDFVSVEENSHDTKRLFIKVMKSIASNVLSERSIKHKAYPLGRKSG